MAIVTWSYICGSALLGGVIYCLVCIVNLIRHMHKQDKVLEQFPSAPRHWLFGHILQIPGLNDAGLAHFRGKSAEYPRSSSTWDTCFNGVLQLNHPDHVKQVLMRSDPKPKRGPYTFGRPWLGDGLVLSNGAKWNRNRKLLTHAFHFDILRPYVVVMNRTCEILMEKMENCASNHTDMPLFMNISLCALDTILRCAFSYDNDVQTKGEGHPYVEAVNDLSALWLQRALSLVGYTPFWQWTSSGRKFRRHCHYVRNIASDVIHSRKQTMNIEKLNTSKCLDFLDMLLAAKDDDGKGLTDVEILDEVTTFMFGGHDTTSSAISWTLYQLCRNPDYQDICRQEVDTILEGRDSDEILWADLSRMTYLTMCIREALRLHTVVPGIQRQLAEDMVIDGKLVPAGTLVSISMYMLHHNPTVWENTMEFNPERFSAANMEKTDTFASVPFSAGPRNCIGQHFAMNEQKVTIARILRRFRISLDPDYQLETKLGIIIQPKDSLKIRITPRTDV